MLSLIFLILSLMLAVIATLLWINRKAMLHRLDLQEQLIINLRDLEKKRSIEEEQLREAARDVIHLQETLDVQKIIEKKTYDRVLMLERQVRMASEEKEKELAYFLASAVHDIRQPVQVLSNVLTPLSRSLQVKDIESTYKYLRWIKISVTNLQHLLRSILDVSQIESGRINPTLADICIQESIQVCLDMWSDKAAENSVHLEMDACSEPIFCHSDKNLIERVIGNLIDNGIKYKKTESADQSHVSISISYGTNDVYVTVADNGIGFAQEDMQSKEAFDPFKRLTNSNLSGEKGLGLGLYIVKKLLYSMRDHSLEYSSELGVGTSFILKIPKSLRQNTTTPVLKEYFHDDEPSIQEFSGLYFWIVDDDLLVLDSLCIVLQSLGVTVEKFESYEDYQDRSTTLERAPDLLIVDYNLPRGRTATDIAMQLSIDWGPTPLIVLTGSILPFENFSFNGFEYTILRKPAAIASVLSSARKLLKPGGSERAVI